MSKQITVMLDDGHVEVRGEMLFDPQEGTLHILGEGGAQVTFNWDKIQFFAVQPCEECNACALF